MTPLPPQSDRAEDYLIDIESARNRPIDIESASNSQAVETDWVAREMSLGFRGRMAHALKNPTETLQKPGNKGAALIIGGGALATMLSMPMALSMYPALALAMSWRNFAREKSKIKMLNENMGSIKSIWKMTRTALASVAGAFVGAPMPGEWATYILATAGATVDTVIQRRSSAEKIVDHREQIEYALNMRHFPTLTKILASSQGHNLLRAINPTINVSPVADHQIRGDAVGQEYWEAFLENNLSESALRRSRKTKIQTVQDFQTLEIFLQKNEKPWDVLDNAVLEPHLKGNDAREHALKELLAKGQPGKKQIELMTGNEYQEDVDEDTFVTKCTQQLCQELLGDHPDWQREYFRHPFQMPAAIRQKLENWPVLLPAIAKEYLQRRDVKESLWNSLTPDEIDEVMGVPEIDSKLVFSDEVVSRMCTAENIDHMIDRHPDVRTRYFEELRETPDPVTRKLSDWPQELPEFTANYLHRVDVKNSLWKLLSKKPTVLETFIGPPDIESVPNDTVLTPEKVKSLYGGNGSLKKGLYEEIMASGNPPLRHGAVFLNRRLESFLDGLTDSPPSGIQLQVSGGFLRDPSPSTARLVFEEFPELVVEYAAYLAKLQPDEAERLPLLEGGIAREFLWKSLENSQKLRIVRAGYTSDESVRTTFLSPENNSARLQYFQDHPDLQERVTSECPAGHSLERWWDIPELESDVSANLATEKARLAIWKLLSPDQKREMVHRTYATDATKKAKFLSGGDDEKKVLKFLDRSPARKKALLDVYQPDEIENWWELSELESEVKPLLGSPDARRFVHDRIEPRQRVEMAGGTYGTDEDRRRDFLETSERMDEQILKYFAGNIKLRNEVLEIINQASGGVLTNAQIKRLHELDEDIRTKTNGKAGLIDYAKDLAINYGGDLAIKGLTSLIPIPGISVAGDMLQTWIQRQRTAKSSGGQSTRGSGNPPS